MNTGLRLAEGMTYTVSYDVEAQYADREFEIILQRDQWNERGIHWNKQAGHSEFNIEITGETAGALWIYIASGANENKITLKNLSVKAHESGYINESFSVGQVYSNNYDGGSGSVKCEYGKIVYDINSFGNDWGQNEIGTPAFALSGAAGNFVITFKAKATAPVSCVLQRA